MNKELAAKIAKGLNTQVAKINCLRCGSLRIHFREPEEFVCRKCGYVWTKEK